MHLQLLRVHLFARERKSPLAGFSETYHSRLAQHNTMMNPGQWTGSKGQAFAKILGFQGPRADNDVSAMPVLVPIWGSLYEADADRCVLIQFGMNVPVKSDRKDIGSFSLSTRLRQ